MRDLGGFQRLGFHSFWLGLRSYARLGFCAICTGLGFRDLFLFGANSETFGFRSFSLVLCFQRFEYLELLAFSTCGDFFCFILFSEFSGFERSLLLSGFSAFVLMGGDRVLDTVVEERRGRGSAQNLWKK